MYTAKLENKSGEIIELTHNASNWEVVSITGLNPPAAQVNTTPIAGMDGSKFNSSKVGTRQIVITLVINGNIEANRQTLYRFCRTKEPCKFYFKNANRDVFIEGYVETAEVDLFALGQLLQIAIICPQPYFKAIDQIIEEISSVVSAFVFPFSINEGDPIAFSTLEVNREVNIYNASESETGIEIEMYCAAPVSKIEIADVTTGDSFELDYNFIADDIILINTNKGAKSVRLLRSGVYYNLFSAVKKGSVFFQLVVGDNYFSYLADDGDENANVSVTIKRYNSYRGV